MHADRWTDGQDDKGAFCRFANAPNNQCHGNRLTDSSCVRSVQGLFVGVFPSDSSWWGAKPCMHLLLFS